MPNTRTAKTALIRKIKANKNDFMSITWTKADGTERTVFTNPLVKPNITGRGTTNVTSLGMMKTYDLLKKGWVTINLQTLKSANLKGVNYLTR